MTCAPCSCERRLQPAAETEPAGQHVAALGPGEHPRNGAQRADALARRHAPRARADVHALDHVERRGRAEEFEELRHRRTPVAGRPRGCVDAIVLHRRELRRRNRRLPRRRVRRRERHGREGALQRAHRDRPQAVALIDHLALLGEAQHAVDRSVGRRLDQMLGAAAAARRRAAARVKNRERDAGVARRLEQPMLRDLQCPARGRNAALLVGVRVADHHPLAIAARREMAPIGGFGVQAAQAARPRSPVHRPTRAAAPRRADIRRCACR